MCCTFLISTCGSSSSENLTYWKQPTTVSSGSCDLTICPTSDDICMIRLDFTTFVITGPNAQTSIQVHRLMGQVAGSSLAEMTGSTMAGNCLLDTFFVQGASPSSNPPEVCGTMTGQHMYVEADTERCNKMVFSLSDGATTATTLGNSRGLTSLATRTWDITASQIECSSLTLPPAGCTQYFWSGLANPVYYLYSANYLSSGTSWHLANQHDRICIRRERGNCIGCFNADAKATDFNVSGNKLEKNYSVPGGCCGYGTSYGSIFGGHSSHYLYQGASNSGIASEETHSYGFDCIIIPGAQVTTLTGNEGVVATTQSSTILTQTLSSAPNIPSHSSPHICGNGGGIGVGASSVEAAAPVAATLVADTDDFTIWGSTLNYTVCTRNSPFVLEFMSDDVEGQGGEVATAGEGAEQLAAYNRGFQLVSTQLACV